jgi:Type IV secretion system pilin
VFISTIRRVPLLVTLWSFFYTRISIMLRLLKNVQTQLTRYGLAVLALGILLSTGFVALPATPVFAAANCPINADPNKPCIGEPAKPGCDPAVPKSPSCPQGVNCTDPDGPTGPRPNDCGLLARYGAPIITFLAAIAGLVAVIAIVLGGIQYASSSDEPQKVAAAKKRIYNAILGLLGFLFLWAFLQWLVPGGVFNAF